MRDDASHCWSGVEHKHAAVAEIGRDLLLNVASAIPRERILVASWCSLNPRARSRRRNAISGTSVVRFAGCDDTHSVSRRYSCATRAEVPWR